MYVSRRAKVSVACSISGTFSDLHNFGRLFLLTDDNHDDDFLVIINRSITVQRRTRIRNLDNPRRHQLIDEIKNHQITACGNNDVNCDREVLLLERDGGVVSSLTNYPTVSMRIIDREYGEESYPERPCPEHRQSWRYVKSRSPSGFREHYTDVQQCVEVFLKQDQDQRHLLPIDIAIRRRPRRSHIENQTVRARFWVSDLHGTIPPTREKILVVDLCRELGFRVAEAEIPPR